MSLLEILKKNKKQIIQAEMAALLHDLDKLCPEFIGKSGFHKNKGESKSVRKEKQKRWQKFIGKDKSIIIDDIDPACIAIAIKGKKIKPDCFGWISCPFVDHHENSAIAFSALAMLVHAGGSGADGIDSDLDKNSGKEGIQQKSVFYIDTPFGYPLREWSNELEKVLDIIQKTDFDNINRIKLMENLSPYFNNALGETRFPCNDVTLWAHSYSVASLTKALLAKVMIEYQAGDFTAEHPYLLPKRKIINAKDINPEHNPTDFTLLKITFDREWILGTAQKAGDIAGMVDQIEILQDQLQLYYENDLLIGNETYRDEYRQLFILPRLGTWQKSGRDVFPELHQKFEKAIRKILDEKITTLLTEYDCHGFPYAIDFADSTDFVNPLLESKRILTRTRKLLKEEAVCNQSVAAMLVIAKDNATGERCEVCGLQKAANNRERICNTCHKRRHNKDLTEKRNIVYEHITSNLGSLIDYNEENKLLLLSISFDLSYLWNGDLFENINWEDEKGKKNHKNTSPGRLFRSHETLQFFFKTFREKVAGLYPNRIFPITLSPVRMEFVVSAHGMDDVITLLYRQYEEQFGKIRIHLPLTVGGIVFYHKFPLYVALEAANRMRKHLKPQDKTFTIVQNKESNSYSDLLLKLECCGKPVAVNWIISTCRSDGERDSFYPYFNVGGNNTHVQQIEPGAELNASEGCFDFLLLDSAVRRFAITPQGLKHHISGSRQAWPFTSWQNFQRLGFLLEKLEKSQISHIENLLVEKRMQWGEAWQGSDDVIRQFCTSVVMSPNGFGKKKKDGRYLLLDEKSNGKEVVLDSDKALLINAAVNGLLLDVIDFFLHLKG